MDLHGIRQGMSRILGTKEAELNDVLLEQIIDIVVITETMNKLKEAKELNDYNVM